MTTRKQLTFSRHELSRALIAIVIIAFFAFGDFPIFVYSIKVVAIIGLMIVSRYIKKDVYLAWIISFALWCACSYIWAIDKDIVLSYFVWFLQAVLLAFAIGTSVSKPDDIEFILKCIMIGGLILTFRSLRGVSFADLGTFRIGENIGYNSNELALKASLSSIIAFRYFRESNTKIKQFLFLLVSGVSLCAILFSESRKGIVMVFFSIYLYSVICSSNSLKFLRNSIIAFIGLIFIYILMTKVEFFYESFGRRFLLIFNIFDDGAYVGNSISNRLNAVDLGILAFKNKPVAGYGLGNYMVATGLRGYAHNNYIQLLVDLGIIGFAIYYSFYLRNIIYLVKNIRINRGLTSMLLSMLLVIIVIEYGLVSFNSDYVQLVIMLSYYLTRINKEKIEKDKNKNNENNSLSRGIIK